MESCYIQNDGEAGAYPSRAGCAHKMVDNQFLTASNKDERRTARALTHTALLCHFVCVWGETEGNMAVEATITPSTDTHTHDGKSYE